DYRLVSPDYFATMRIPIVEGRGFTDADDSTAQHVTIINQAMATKFFPGEDPIGKRLLDLGMDSHKTTPLTIIGVAADVRSADLARAAGPQHFISYRQRPERAHYGVFVIRTKVDAASLGQTVRSRLRALDPNVLTQIETVTDIRARSLGDRRFTMVVLSGFALLGLLLAAIGIYGVLAYSVARRTREIGVRMALGAMRGTVVQMIVGDSLTPVLVGAGVGIVGALVLTRLMAAFVYGVTTTDPVTFASVVAVLLAVGILASAVPAWRAARVDPVVALRED
ncbi:MAG TPA: FtsX-like permease family protein, partial [Gemmatimonadaceae bacterium]